MFRHYRGGVTHSAARDDRMHDERPTWSDELTFDNRFVDELPADPTEGSQLRQVAGAAYSRVRPTPVSGPRIAAWSFELADELGLDERVWEGDEAAQILTGNVLLPGSDPYAMNYGGHQFGNWAGQLGDGRAIALGEVIDRNGQHQTLQLKGAGPTPYSRRADGLAVLRSSVREFLCSEAMHHLGIPTTRALSLAVTGDDVVRDMFYDGHPRPEPGAIVCRVAPSFLRFGSYQLPAARGDLDLLRQLVDFTIVEHFSHLGPPSAESYAAWFDEVCQTSCAMVVEWMRVGFVHGVMNTDNMSVLGLTIDYGPYGWLDDFDPQWTPNTTDAGGRRYRFGHQPQIVQWNLLQLANAIVALVGDPGQLEASLTGFADDYRRRFHSMMQAKLGLSEAAESSGADEGLIGECLEVLQLVETDMTIFFRRLARLQAEPATDHTGGVLDDGVLLGEDGVGDAFYEPSALVGADRERLLTWLTAYLARVGAETSSSDERATAMNRVNPVYVLRNYLAQEAIDKAELGDYSGITGLLDVVRDPYDEKPELADYATKRPDWARERPGCSMLSCSS